MLASNRPFDLPTKVVVYPPPETFAHNIFDAALFFLERHYFLKVTIFISFYPFISARLGRPISPNLRYGTSFWTKKLPSEVN